MDDEALYRAFAFSIRKTNERILDLIEKHPEMKAYPVPADWRATQVLLRSIAEDLMLCADLDSAVEKMKEDKATLLVLVALTLEVSDDYKIRTLESAFAASPKQSDFLPGLPYAMYLLEVAKGSPPVWR